MRLERVTVLALAISLMAIGTPPDLDAQLDATSLAAEVRATWDSYINAFSEGRADLIADRFYTAPSFHGGAEGVSTVLTAGELQAAFQAVLESLARQDYRRSETRRATICVLTETTAFLDAEYVRYRADDSVLMTGAGTYLFTKRPEGWRIAGQVPHATAKALSCSS